MLAALAVHMDRQRALRHDPAFPALKGGRDVSLGYEGQSVLTHLDLTVRAGDYLCIVGDNGSGKSTLLRGLLGLIAPQSGQILRSPELERGAIGYLPQQTRAQRDFPATVYEVVLSGCLNRKGMRFFYSAAQKSQALMNMGKLGILENEQ